MQIDRREKSVEQSTNAILNPSARSENTFFVNCPVYWERQRFSNKSKNRFLLLLKLCFLSVPDTKLRPLHICLQEYTLGNFGNQSNHIFHSLQHICNVLFLPHMRIKRYLDKHYTLREGEKTRLLLFQGMFLLGHAKSPPVRRQM